MNGDKMKKKLLIFLGIALSLGAIGAIIYASITLNKQQKLEDSYLIELSYDELVKKIENKDSFVLVYTQTTCSHCIEYKPILKKTLYKNKLYGYEIVIDKLNTEEKAKLKDIANVSGTPTTIFIKDGVEISTSSRLTGIQTEDKLTNRYNIIMIVFYSQKVCHSNITIIVVTYMK